MVEKREKVTGKEYRKQFRVLERHEDAERQDKSASLTQQEQLYLIPVFLQV